jgi:hypothetical protein
MKKSQQYIQKRQQLYEGKPTAIYINKRQQLYGEKSTAL